MNLGKFGKFGFGILSLAFALSANSFADPTERPQYRPGQPAPAYGGDVEYRLRELERQVYDLTRNVNHLQRRVDALTTGPVPPPAEIVSVCMLQDGLFGKTFLSAGRSGMDAEYGSRKACQDAGITASYCSPSSSRLKCDDNSRNPYAAFSCLITDGLFGKVYRGEGRTPVEAEARSKIACQNAGTTASYCGNQAARCEQLH
jgi:hypothetical protein